MELGNQLKQYRKKLEYTQEQMAAFLETVLITYQSWEQGKRRPLKAFQKMLLQKIEKKLKDKHD